MDARGRPKQAEYAPRAPNELGLLLVTNWRERAVMVSQQAPEAGRGEQEEIILGDAGVEKKAATSKKDVRKKKKKTKKADENVLSSINKAIGRVATEQGNKIVGCAHGWAKKVEMNPGPFILAAGGFLFLVSALDPRADQLATDFRKMGVPSCSQIMPERACVRACACVHERQRACACQSAIFRVW